MPRKRKISENQQTAADGAIAGNGSAEPAAVKKKRPPRRKPAAKKEETGKLETHISDEAIWVRAYHIAQERARRGIPGDENSDWLEARRQLSEEQG